MRFRKILAATDGSEHAVRAIEAAADLAHGSGAELTVATVVYIPTMYRVDLGSELEEGFRVDGRAILADAGRVVERAGARARTELLEGKPAAEIVSLVVKDGYDLIVLGRYGLSGSEDKHLGGVSDAVLSRVSCSVLLVH
jgi:nucleotide-binding universal stress UspA family protein